MIDDIDPEAGVTATPGPERTPDGLFGAALAPGTVLWNPVPAVTINGIPIPGGPPADGNLAGLVAIDKLAVTWGTDQPMDQPPPATATVSLLDFTRTYATRQDLVGLPVVLSWSTTQASRVFFRGRIADLDITRVKVARPDGSTVPAARLDLTCSSIEVDLANRFPAETEWPAETVGERATRIAAYCAGVANSVVVISTWAPGNCAAVTDVNKTSIRDLLVQLYTSTGGRRLIYSPERQTYEWMTRATVDARSLQRLWIGTGTHPRAGLGAWIGPDVTGTGTTETGWNGTPSPTPLFLDADWLEYPHGMTRQASSRITRVSVTAKSDADNSDLTVVKVDTEADETLVGQRVVTFDSVYRSDSYTNSLAADLLSMATQEGAAWRPQRIRWDTRRTGGFPHHGQAAALLIGHMTGFPVSINGSWVAAYAVRPLFRITGGVITYHGGPNNGWDLEMDVAGWATFTSPAGGPRWVPVPQHALTFEEIDDGTDANTLRWYDDDNPNGLHESVTFEDMGHVGRGRGNTTIGPNQGYDL